MLSGKHLELFENLEKTIPSDRLFFDDLRTLAHGTDGSFYRLIPKLVVIVENENEAAEVIKQCYELKIPITYRAAGTSLSGQSISDSVLMKVSRDWRGYKINDNASKISMEPALIGKYANLYLSEHHKKIGPDPASINSAMIAGIAANNASGMTSGTNFNTYNTLESMRIIFNDGTVLDTSDEQSRKEFEENKKNLLDDVNKLVQTVKENGDLTEKIKEKFSIKNTTGYGLNSLIDFDDPFEVIQHLMIGSEGTLGFISEITLRTVPDPPLKATSLMIFKNIDSACKAIPIFENQKVKAAELMDRAALRSVEDKPGMPEYLKTLSNEAAALLVETSADSEENLNKQIKSITESISELNTIIPVEFTTDLKEYKKLWDVRKGLFPSACKSRKDGTTVIIEDVNFPTNKLAEAALELQKLFDYHGYHETIIWGHSLAGNLHFVFHQDFSDANEVVRYDNFMKDITKLVVEKYNGSLKAEHGTGRNMAPFVKYEWGEQAYEIMKDIKNAFDKVNILNPGVIINTDSKIHIKNLKSLPIADKIIDKCIECGFCESACPSKDLTLTPRQRIVVWREIQSMKRHNTNPSRLNNLSRNYDYFGEKTCAVDGLCELDCPVDINTGKLIKSLRSEKSSKSSKGISNLAAEHMEFLTKSIKHSLNAVDLVHKAVGSNIMDGLSKTARKLSGGLIPQWNKYIPKGADPIIEDNIPTNGNMQVVYFPSCISRSMGITKDSDVKDSQTTRTYNLLKKAGYNIKYPNNMNGLCCGMPFSSKGFFEESDKKSEELLVSLLEASDNGRVPILFDTSPCLYHIKDFIKNSVNEDYKKIEILEPVEFIHEFLLDKLTFNKIKEPISLHVTCSSKKMNLDEKFKIVAEKCSEKVIIPENVSCCGFAGDRGFSYPELNESALKNLKKELPSDCKHGYSNSKTCEIGLSVNSGIEYKSIVYLVDECTN